MVKSHPAVTQRLVEKAAEAGVSSVSQYVADVLALYVGLPQHVRELNQTPIIATRRIDPLRGDARGRIAIRPHREVSDRLAAQAADNGTIPPGQVSPYIADILAAHVGLPEHARPHIQIEEVLSLAM
jgi:hypothetical protein